MSGSALEDLTRWSSRLQADGIPTVVRDHALRVVADTMAVAIAGGAEPEVRATSEAAETWGGTGRSVSLSTGRGLSPYAAAVVNGQAAISLELDEGSQWATNHPSAHVLPAVLAAAQHVGASGAELLTAFVVGYEVAVRAGQAMTLRPAVHPFGTAMVVGAAAGVCRVLDLAPAQTADALRVAAALTPASTQRAANTGATVRNLVTGVCSGAGVLAASASRAGVSGDLEALRTVYGVVLGERFELERLSEGLGAQWLMTRNYFKVHACSRWNHAPIEATEKILRAHRISADDVESVTVHTFAPATRLSNQDPPNGFAGKHSIPYNVAVRIVLGDNGVEAYRDDVVHNPAVRAVMARVRVVEDPAYTAAQPAVRAARVELTTTDGKVLSATEDHAPGGFDNPYPSQVLDAKFEHLVTRGWSADLVAPLRRWVAGLPGLSDLGGLSELFARHPQQPKTG